MNHYLSRRAVLKLLEKPFLYHLSKDELYELDDHSFRFLKKCMSGEGGRSKNGPFIDYCMDQGLLTAETVVMKRPRLVQAPAPSLRYLELEITKACNLRCGHCAFGDGAGNEELSPAQIRRVLEEFDRMQGLQVMVSGGEPLLHSRFEEINEMLPDFFVRKVLFTNGVLLTRNSLRNLKMDEIRVSIDGIEAGHDALRGAGTYGMAIRAVRQALDAGFDVSVSTMIHPRNLSAFDSMETLFRELGIRNWTVDVPCPSGRIRQRPDLLVGPREGGRFLGYGFGKGLHSPGPGFGCGLHGMTVSADGKLAKCSFYCDKPAGTIGTGLLQAWLNIRHVPFEDLSCDCGYLEVCGGGCRYRAERMEGKGGKDPYRCSLYGVR